MNGKYLKNRGLTDVIAFDLSNSNKELGGEIYISIDRVKENAREYRTSIAEETRRVMIHGLLHLLGYRDKTIIEKKEMIEEEDKNLHLYKELLEKKCFTRNHLL